MYNVYNFKKEWELCDNNEPCLQVSNILKY